MKSMSMVLHLADCPETLDEARTLLRSQAAEIARLTSEATHWKIVAAYYQGGSPIKLFDDNARLTAENTELREDKARLDYCDSRPMPDFSQVGNDSGWNIRSAIDAARQNGATP